MNIKDSTAPVTGANHGLGLAYASELLEAGAKKVYASGPDPSAVRLAGATTGGVRPCAD